MERGTVSMRVASVLRSAEVQPLFRRFVFESDVLHLILTISHPSPNIKSTPYPTPPIETNASGWRRCLSGLAWPPDAYSLPIGILRVVDWNTTINHHFISQARSSAGTSYTLQCQEQHSDTTRDFHWSNGFQVMHFASRDLLHTIIQSTIIS